MKIVDMIKNSELPLFEIGKIFDSSEEHIKNINKGIIRRIRNIKYPIRNAGALSYLKNKKRDYKTVDVSIYTEIISLLKHTNLKQKDIAKNFEISRNIVTSINIGKVHRILEDCDYPIRKHRVDNAIVRQKKIISMITEGKTNIEISKTLNIKPVDVSYVNKGRVNSEIKDNYSFPIRKMNKHTNKDHIEKICIEILNTKKSLKEIALEFNIGYGTIKSLNSGNNHKDILEKLSLTAPIRRKIAPYLCEEIGVTL